MSDLETRFIFSESEEKLVAENDSPVKHNYARGVARYYDILRKAGFPEPSAVALACKYWGIENAYKPSVVTQE